MTPEEMIERFGPVDESVEADDGFEGPELFNPAIWLEGDDDEDEAFSDCGHVYLSRDFRSSGDPAVLISNTLLAAPEMLDILKAMVKNMEDGLVALGWASIEQYRQACRKDSGDMDPYLKAVEIIEKLKGQA